MKTPCLFEADRSGWLDRRASDSAGQLGQREASVVRIVAGADGVRLVLYAGQPQGDGIVSHGPFIGDSREDIVRLYNEYRVGRFERMSNLARVARVG